MNIRENMTAPDDPLATWEYGNPDCAKCHQIGGAVWMRNPEGGHIALCKPDARALIAEIKRHQEALRKLLPYRR